MIKVITLEAGAPDILDAWLEGEIDQAWGDWLEEIYDPDGPHEELFT